MFYNKESNVFLQRKQCFEAKDTTFFDGRKPVPEEGKAGKGRCRQRNMGCANQRLNIHVVSTYSPKAVMKPAMASMR